MTTVPSLPFSGSALKSALDSMVAENLYFATPTELRANAGAGVAQWVTARTHWPPREYYWISDDERTETSAEDVIVPEGHTGAGRWVYSPRFGRENGVHSLPMLAAKQMDLTVDDDYRVVILGDSLTAKYTTALPNSLTDFFTRQFRAKYRIVLEQAYSVSGGTVGAENAVSEDDSLSVIGQYHNVSDGATVRIRTGGVDPVADRVRIFYAEQSGGGTLTLTLTAETTGETAIASVSTDGSGAGHLDLTLSGFVTGSTTGKRLQIDVSAASGPVALLRWSEAWDGAVTGTRLVYNRFTARGGYTFDPDILAANAGRLAGQIVDYDPDLILVEYADPVDDGRRYLDTLLDELESRDCWPDILLIGSSVVYEAGVSDDLSGAATAQNGDLVSNSRLHAGFLRAMAEIRPNVYFHDFGAVIRSQAQGLATGAYTDADHVHPQQIGNAMLLADLVRSIPTYDAVSAMAYTQALITRSLKLVAADNEDTESTEGMCEATFDAAGDAIWEYKRKFSFRPGGTETALVNSFGVATKEVRFTGSSSKLTSTVAGQISANGSRILSIGAATSASDAAQLQQVSQIYAADSAANIASVAAAINTTGKFAGRLVRDTTNNRAMMARGSDAADPWDVVDGSASVTPS